MRRHRLSRLALASSLAVVLVLPVFAEPTKIKVDGTVIKGYITYLASDDQPGPPHADAGVREGRRVGGREVQGVGPEAGRRQRHVLPGGAHRRRAVGLVWTTGIPALVVNGRTFYLRDGELRRRHGVHARREGRRRGRVRRLRHLGAGQGPRRVRRRGREGQDRARAQGLAEDGARRRACSSRRPPRAEAPRPAGAKTSGPRRSTDQAKIMTAYEKGAAAVMLYNPDAGAGGGDVRRWAAMGARGEAVDAGGVHAPVRVRVERRRRACSAAIMWRDPQESPRGFAARIDGMRADIKDKKARSVATGVKAALKGYDTVTCLQREVQEQRRRATSSRRSRAPTRR